MHLVGAPGLEGGGLRSPGKRHHRLTVTTVPNASPVPAVPPQTLLHTCRPQSPPSPGLHQLKFYLLLSASAPPGVLLSQLGLASTWSWSRRARQGRAEAGTRQGCTEWPDTFPVGRHLEGRAFSGGHLAAGTLQAMRVQAKAWAAGGGPQRLPWRAKGSGAWSGVTSCAVMVGRGGRRCPGWFLRELS